MTPTLPQKRKIASASFTALILLVLSGIMKGPLRAQESPSKAPADASSVGQGASSAPGFSIESEMLSYRALESNSQAVACDVAAYLTGGSAEFNTSSKVSTCTVKNGSKKASVVIVPFDAPILDSFRLWRADMEIMGDLRSRAGAYCPESNVLAESPRGAATGATTTAPAPSPGLAVFTPAGSALSLAQSVAGLFASQTSTSIVGGTIHDQAFMDGVARELRAFGVGALIPTVYLPSSLAAADVSTSPFIYILDRLMAARICLKDLGGKGDTPPVTKATITQITSEIESYLDTFGAGASISKDGGSGKPKNGGSDAPGDAKTNPASAAPGANGYLFGTYGGPSSSLLSILAADDLAQKLGIDKESGLPKPDSPWQHVLVLKALESGGSVTRKSNLFGTKIRYSGGSVGSYALFTVNGEVECSGNVYAYGGPLPDWKFGTELRRYMPDPTNQFVLQTRGCRAAGGR